MRLLMTRFIGFLLFKNLLVLPVKNVKLLGKRCYRLFTPTKRHSRCPYPPNPLFKSWIKDSEYLLLVADIDGVKSCKTTSSSATAYSCYRLFTPASSGLQWVGGMLLDSKFNSFC
jgi:hypothetical protein